PIARGTDRPILSSRASSAASFSSDTATESCFAIRGNPKNEIARFQGIRPESLQSQLAPTARKRLSFSNLEVLHGRPNNGPCTGTVLCQSLRHADRLSRHPPRTSQSVSRDLRLSLLSKSRVATPSCAASTARHVLQKQCWGSYCHDQAIVNRVR